MEGEERMSIYKATRTIKKKDNTLYNALRSIYEDSIFVSEISQLWPELPLMANLRCGFWYSSKFHGACYFKSTDGHCNNWSFNTSRLNLHVALLAGQKGGCIIVDSTRKGKRFPDSMSKTIPIWTCVLNRAIHNYRQKMHEIICNDTESHTCNQVDRASEAVSIDWDCSLHLPLWVSKIEKASIENRLENWTQHLESSGADIASLSESLNKPLRPLWISQKTRIWLNEVPDYDSWDFTPIILVSASASTGSFQHKTSSEFSWIYIPGAGDDEESWARGLTPSLFWGNAYDIISLGPELCNQKVSEIVEKDQVYRAQRGQDSPQVIVKCQKYVDSNGNHLGGESPLRNDFSSMKINGNAVEEDGRMSWLGSTNVAVGTTNLAATLPQLDCILNCDKEMLDVGPSYAYLHLPMLGSKFDRFSLLNNLPSAVKFARSNLSRGRSLFVCCRDGEDISVCVCLAILMSLFNDEGVYDDGKSLNETPITKWEMRKRLVFICKFATNARPSRGNLKQVFSFLSGANLSCS